MTKTRTPDRRQTLLSGLALGLVAAAPAAAQESSATADVKMFDGHLHLVSQDVKRYPRASGPPPDGAAPPGSAPAPSASVEAGKPRLLATTENLLGWMDAAGVQTAAAIQRVSSYGTDNSYMLDSADAHPEHFRPVVVFDARDPGTPARVAALAKSRNIAGLRLTGGKAPQGGFPWMDSPEALKSWAAVDAAGLVMDLGYAPQRFSAEALEAILRLARMFPRVAIVLDHMGRPRVEGAPGFGFADLPAGLNGQRNVFFKFTTENLYDLEAAKISDRAFLRHMADRFGAERILWGSNMGTSAGTYAEMAQRARQAASALTPAEQRQVLRETGFSLFVRRG